MNEDCICGHPQASHARIGGCAAKGTKVECRETVRWSCRCEQYVASWTVTGEYAKCAGCGHSKNRHHGPGDCRLMRDDATVCPCPGFEERRP